jgi:hypothetical protein
MQINVTAGDEATPYWRSVTTPRALAVGIDQYDSAGEATRNSCEGAGRSDRADADNSDLHDFTSSCRGLAVPARRNRCICQANQRTVPWAQVQAWMAISLVDFESTKRRTRTDLADVTRNSTTAPQTCLAEQGAFEPLVPLELIWAEFGPSLAHYSTRNKSIRAGENLFARGSALLRISPVPFFARLMLRTQ